MRTHASIFQSSLSFRDQIGKQLENPSSSNPSLSFSSGNPKSRLAMKLIFFISRTTCTVSLSFSSCNWQSHAKKYQGFYLFLYLFVVSFRAIILKGTNYHYLQYLFLHQRIHLANISLDALRIQEAHYRTSNKLMWRSMRIKDVVLS